MILKREEEEVRLTQYEKILLLLALNEEVDHKPRSLGGLLGAGRCREMDSPLGASRKALPGLLIFTIVRQ